jgi:uncharacterized protein YdeI (YjbR/CyaY-like superfamily)
MQKIPTDISKALSSSPATKLNWGSLTAIARRDFVSWVESAKQPETRRRRIERIPAMLASGKRRPCCYAIVPMNLYKALANTPKARLQWKTLTSDERRDFVDWIGSVKEPEARRHRVEKACRMLAAGKRCH